MFDLRLGPRSLPASVSPPHPPGFATRPPTAALFPLVTARFFQCSSVEMVSPLISMALGATTSADTPDFPMRARRTDSCSKGVMSRDMCKWKDWAAGSCGWGSDKTILNGSTDTGPSLDRQIHNWRTRWRTSASEPQQGEKPPLTCVGLTAAIHNRTCDPGGKVMPPTLTNSVVIRGATGAGGCSRMISPRARRLVASSIRPFGLRPTATRCIQAAVGRTCLAANRQECSCAPISACLSGFRFLVADAATRDRQATFWTFATDRSTHRFVKSDLACSVNRRGRKP